MNHEEEIGRVMAALNRAEPGPALESRVLARLNTSMVVQQRPGPVRWIRWSGVSAGFVAVVLCVSGLRHLVVPSAVEKVAVVPGVKSERNPIVPTTLPAANFPTPRETLVKGPARIALALDAPALRETPPDRGLADLPSVLAPPEQATRQERQLVRIAHGPGPEEFELLNPEKQILVAQQREADFNRFFPPQVPQEIYLATHTDN